MELPSSLLETTIERGTILHSTMFENISHGKFFVVMEVTKEYVAGFFYINSNINVNVITTPAQRELQYEITPKDYSFLTHKSYIGAASLSKCSRAEIVDTLQNGLTQIKGKLKEEHMQELLGLLRKSKLYSAIDKRTFFS